MPRIALMAALSALFILLGGCGPEDQAKAEAQTQKQPSAAAVEVPPMPPAE